MEQVEQGGYMLLDVVEEEQSRVQEGVVYFDMGVQADRLNIEAQKLCLFAPACDCHMAVPLIVPEENWVDQAMGPA